MSQSGHKNYKNLAAFFRVSDHSGTLCLNPFSSNANILCLLETRKNLWFWNIGQKWVKGSKCSHIFAIPQNMLQRPIGNKYKDHLKRHKDP